jgi:hypothetical protein
MKLLLHLLRRFMAQNGPHAMSDIGPLTRPKRTCRTFRLISVMTQLGPGGRSGCYSVATNRRAASAFYLRR